MITEDFVSYEAAKLLKERGFESDDCHTAYDENGEFFLHGDYSKDRHGIVDAPTLQMAMKWLREVHKIEVRVIYDNDKSSWYGACNPMRESSQILLGSGRKCKSYEEACEDGIRYCLENLI